MERRHGPGPIDTLGRLEMRFLWIVTVSLMTATVVATFVPTASAQPRIEQTACDTLSLDPGALQHGFVVAEHVLD